jgi:ribonuclease HII
LTHKYIIGVDEVGTGAIAGPITVGACYVPPTLWDEIRSWGFDDSKKIREDTRNKLNERLRSEGTALGVRWVCASVSPQDVDKLEPLDAVFKAFRTAILTLISQLGCRYEDVTVIFDGVYTLPTLPKEVHQIAVPKGDVHYLPVSVASVMAKHDRDQQMISIGKSFPLFYFDRNKGYPTLEHLTMILRLGPIYSVHRKHALRGILLDHWEKYMQYVIEKPSWLNHDKVVGDIEHEFEPEAEGSC